ncbi:trace amine-associated receptor 5-like [Pteronotus mesoamericanus]|uniref:trace amine-associated receptor 5-like n=1 Tax=Pteronotus mesoamericanus TaxID=1884717 RepID=UPI0023EBE2A7|nr:trace amine-associated receptor 5-like [Pteronotus parnellii mesoamericanus]
MSAVLNKGAENHPLAFCYQVNGSCPRTAHPLGLQLTIYLACAAGIIVTVLGNLFVVFAVSYFKALHTPTNFLLLSLAVADMILGLLVLPLSTIRSAESCWFFGDFLCRLHTCLDTLFRLIPIFHLCFISIDRHCAICEPLLYPSKFTVRVAHRYIIAGRGAPGAYTAFFVYTDVVKTGLSQWLEEMPCVGSCQLLFNKFQGWLNFPVFFFSCLIMISLYVKILVVAARQAQQINVFNKNLGGTAKHDRKATKTLGIAVGIYRLFWLPFTIDTLVDSLLNFMTPPLVFDTLIWLAYFTSACNPIIYVFSYRWFRKALKLTLSPEIFSPRTPTIDLYQE